MNELEELEPRRLWRHFAALCLLPRPSGQESAAAEHVRAWAAARGFATAGDEAGNLVVRVPAAAGREGAPAVVLQAHLDMVGEKNEGVEHDFHRDPILVRVDGEWVGARGTTLGADNGIGVAAAMAAAEEGLRHGPLELLFTVEEETGLVGARGLDPGLVRGRLLVNLDSEEDGALYIGCAGAGGLEGSLELAREAAAAPGSRAFELRLRGLAGGHSGLDIVRNRGNAIKLMARLLGRAVEDGPDFQLISIDGGDKGNAIPREASARILLGPEQSEAFGELARKTGEELRAELGSESSSLMIELRPVEHASSAPWPPLRREDRDRLLLLIAAFPDGVRAMSREVPGLVETSSNLARIRTTADAASFLCSCRSSVDSALAAELRALEALCRLAGARAAARVGYPGWRPRPDSPLVRRTAGMHEEVLGEAPELKAVHAGLECGVLAQKLPGLDAVSIGPEIRGAHSPDERVQVPSVRRFYRLLTALLEDLAASPLG